MPTGSLIPHLFINGKPMPLCIYITWLIFGIKFTFYGGRTFIHLETARKEFFTTTITIWHGANEFWHPQNGPITETVWKIEMTSQHWVALAWTLQEHGFPWAKTKVLCTDVIRCEDAQVEGSIFGIKSSALFD